VSDERDSLPMLSVDELEALWRVAWPMASGACRSTIKRLKCGLGGFYDADDFQQDAFLAFRDLALRCGARLAVSGHTHVGSVVREEGTIFLNPGSASLPKGRDPASCAIADGEGISILTLEGTLLHREPWNL